MKSPLLLLSGLALSLAFKRDARLIAPTRLQHSKNSRAGGMAATSDWPRGFSRMPAHTGSWCSRGQGPNRDRQNRDFHRRPHTRPFGRRSGGYGIRSRAPTGCPSPSTVRGDKPRMAPVSVELFPRRIHRRHSTWLGVRIMQKRGGGMDARRPSVSGFRGDRSRSSANRQSR